jgi:histidinol dehydrogenase
VGSLVVAVTTDPAHSDALLAVLEHELSAAPTAPGERAGPPGVDASEAEGAACAIVDASDPAEAIAIANALAPEHLQLIGAEIETLAWSVRSAGCLLIGAGSATAFTDYVVGSNHVLPTGGAARFASMLSARHFRRRRAEVRIGAEAAAKLAKAGAPIARTEGFEWHARSMEARMGDNYTP